MTARLARRRARDRNGSRRIPASPAPRLPAPDGTMPARPMRDLDPIPAR